MTVRILIGDVREQLRLLPADSFDCVVTSPPYWGLRDYGTATWVGGSEDCDHSYFAGGNGPASAKQVTSVGTQKYQFNGICKKCSAVRVDHQIGLEPTLGEHLDVMVDVFAEVWRVMKPTATLWLNYGDCYATSPNGRSAADTKAVGNDDRTFRDKPFSTIGAIYDHEGGQVPDSKNPKARAGQSGNKGNDAVDFGGRIRAMGGYLKAKDLCMIPNRLAIALQEAGWWVRSEIIWHKPNPMPESIKDRPGSSHEKVWLLSKAERYQYDNEAVKEPAVSDHPSGNGYAREERLSYGGRGQPDGWSDVGGLRNLRNVWTIPTAAFAEAHFATFPPELAERCIKAGCPINGHVLDPFGGAGTTGLVADRLQRNATLIELNPEYAALATRRINDDAPLFVEAV